MSTDTSGAQGANATGPTRSKLRSLAVGVAGLAVASVLAVAVGQLHLGVLAGIVGISLVCPLIPGWVVGLLDHRRPFATAGVAMGVFGIGVLALVLGKDDPEPWALIPFALAGWLIAPFAALAAHRARRWRPAAALGSALIVWSFVAAFIVPEISLRRDVGRFLTTRFDDVLACVGREVVRAPATGLSWQHEPRGGIYRGVKLNASWTATTKAVGPGHCSLRLSTRRLPMTGPFELDDIDAMRFSFEPQTPAHVRTDAEAEALLRELKVRKQGRKLENGLTAWVGFRMQQNPRGTNPRYEVRVERNGTVRAWRTVPWID